ncbi:uncharacterized protein LOC142814433 [Rhipicephalus microplus]|uniref:uncharacterized protein LOC142814433 n=1 Tax=Rhipicephalus microplus TaxID=6941 RepID=UPI003F6C235A
MMSSNDPDFRKLHLKTMARYPRYCVGADAARSSCSRVLLYKVNTTVDVEQTFEGGTPDESQPPSAVSSSQLVEGHPESTDYQASQEPSAAQLSFPQKEKEQLKDRVRRLLEKEDRFFRELRRDCFLIALVLILLVVLILWFASGGFFNGPKPRPVPPKGGPLKIIMDVDTGVDDAMALILALTSEHATVEAITIVAGNAYRDAAYNNTLRVLNLLGRTDVGVLCRARAMTMLNRGRLTDAHDGLVVSLSIGLSVAYPPD